MRRRSSAAQSTAWEAAVAIWALLTAASALGAAGARADGAVAPRVPPYLRFQDTAPELALRVSRARESWAFSAAGPGGVSVTADVELRVVVQASRLLRVEANGAVSVGRAHVDARELRAHRVWGRRG